MAKRMIAAGTLGKGHPSLESQLETSVALARALRDARLAADANVVPAEKLPSETDLQRTHAELDEIIWKYWSRSYWSNRI